MLPILTAEQMRRCDNDAIHFQEIPSRTLMERAAHGVVSALLHSELFQITPQTRIWALCGGGNNGGDGFAAARFLKQAGYEVTVCYAGRWHSHVPHSANMSQECIQQYTLWIACGGSVTRSLPDDLSPDRDVIIDALLGIGLHDAPAGLYAQWIDAVNAAGLPVLSVDIPSGVVADDGTVPGSAIHATLTVTMAFPKYGLLLYPGAGYAGKISILDIGVNDTVLFEHPPCPTTLYVQPDDLALLPSRPAHAHKGTFGRVLVIGGKAGMSGAVYFAALSAYRAGAGLVEILSDEQNRLPLQTLLPEAIFTAYTPGQAEDGTLCPALSRANAIVLGCGLGQDAAALSLLTTVLQLRQSPLVLDADALNILSAHEELLPLLESPTQPLILTPHLGEAARLLQQPVESIAANLLQSARDLAARYHAICVLKDTTTVVTDGRWTLLQNCGNSGMATGGSGDCLAGVIASLLSQHRNAKKQLPTVQCVALGVLLHAMAGDAAATARGTHAIMASDIATAVGTVLRQYFPYREQKYE